MTNFELRPGYSIDKTASDVRALYQPGQIGKTTLRNRFVQSPIFTQYATTMGEVGDRIIDYYRARARGGVGLMITENCSVDWEIGRSVGHPIRIDHDRYVTGLADLVEAVHDEGGRLAVQLHHTGRQNAGNPDKGEPPIAPTEGITSAFGAPPRGLHIDEIPVLIEKYAAGARRAVAAGFDAVELHGAHGYILQQFLSPKTNKRTDKYGGSFENRARFALETVAAVRQAVGPDFPILYRYSVEEPYEGGLPLEEGLKFAQLLEPHVDALDITSGNYDTALTLLPGRIEGSLLEHAVRVKQLVKKPVIGVGRMVWRLAESARAVENNQVDFIAFGRVGLADPDVVRKIQRGESNRVRRCLACNECVSRWMFAAQTTKCVINPTLSREHRAEEARRKVAQPKKVAVVGAGPAGLEAAMLAGERGHHVTLFEKGDAIGGQLRAWAKSPIMHTEIDHLIEQYRVGLEANGVKVQLNAKVSAADLKGFDQVLLATGTNAADTPSGAVDAVTMLASGKAPSGDLFTVYGASEIAVHAALFLAKAGKKVTLASPAASFATDSNDMMRMELEQDLAKANIPVKLEAPAPKEGTVVWAGARTSDNSFSDIVDDYRVVPIGTRLRGGRLFEATQSGFWAAARV